MATLAKKKNRLGAPPPPTAAFNNLAEPEVAPSNRKVDGRTLKKTGMTEQFNTRLTKETLTKLRSVAQAEGRTIGKIIELSLDSYTTNN